MDKITTASGESREVGPLWETVEDYARGEIQQFVQRLLEEEVEARAPRWRSFAAPTAGSSPTRLSASSEIGRG